MVVLPQASRSRNMFDDDEPMTCDNKDLDNELENYLKQKPDPTVRDSEVLSSWKVHCHEFPCLHRMALNYHTIPGQYVILFKYVF